ncbi:MAG: 4Fe-4S binding protein [Oscillospiraceae bacterium]|nr:4Fe-4S binding protein [Oscillospiraceae bacterium]
METKTRKRRVAFVDENACVACGCCAKICPLSAIEIWKGTAASVNTERCVGCGKCAKECPASVMEFREVSV